MNASTSNGGRGEYPSIPRRQSMAHFHCGQFIRSGAGAPKTARRHCHYLKKFDSVTVLNEHIHQLMQKVQGNVTFHTAASTAFPQPQPGMADSPGPLKSASRAAEKPAGNYGCELRPEATRPSGCGLDAWINQKRSGPSKRINCD